METLEILKNCKNCIKKDACKFIDAHHKLVRSDMFYQMFQWPEWNHLDDNFEANAAQYKCYKPAFPNGKLQIGVHPNNILELGLKKHLQKLEIRYASWYAEPTKEGSMRYTESQTRKDVEIPVSDLDVEVKIVNKLTPIL